MRGAFATLLLALAVLTAGSAGDVIVTDSSDPFSRAPAAPGPGAPAISAAAAAAGAATATAPPELLTAADQAPPQPVIVAFNIDEDDVMLEAASIMASAAHRQAAPGGAGAPGAGGALGPSSGPPASVLRAARLNVQAAVKERVLGSRSRAAKRGDMTLLADYAQLPIALVQVDSAAALQALRGDPLVQSVNGNRRRRRLQAAPIGQTFSSLPLIAQPPAFALGYTGVGCAVAVIDTGVDWGNKDLGSCGAPGDPPPCMVAVSKDFTEQDDGKRDDASRHGSRVAAVMAKVAPGVRILSLDVFDGNSTDDATVFRAIDWAIAHHDPEAPAYAPPQQQPPPPAAGNGTDGNGTAPANGTDGGGKDTQKYNICAINLSVGGYEVSDAPCGAGTAGGAYEAAFAAARAAGILAVAAAGNDLQKNATAVPACAPSVLSVGAVWDALRGYTRFQDDRGSASCWDGERDPGTPVCFSNSAPFLSLLAPGVRVVGYHGIANTGTSFAAAHVSGAIAVARAAAPGAVAGEVAAALLSTGTRVTDPGNGVATPRVDVISAVRALRGDAPPPAVATLVAESGAKATRDRTVRLDASYPEGAAEMCVKEGAKSRCGPRDPKWRPVGVTLNYTFKSGRSGSKVIAAHYRDASGAVSDVSAFYRITYDVTPPVLEMEIRPGVVSKDGFVASILTRRNDDKHGSGVAFMHLRLSESPVPPGCPEVQEAAANIAMVSSSDWAFWGLKAGTAYYLRICSVDRLGNVSKGTMAEIKTLP